jgi:hypothetical protein
MLFGHHHRLSPGGNAPAMPWQRKAANASTARSTGK